MGVTIKSTNNIPKLTAALKKIEKNNIKVGVFGHDSNVDEEDINLVTLARVHEFGMTIRPKNGKYLTIPSSPKSKGKRAGDFKDLFFVPTDNGNGLLARNKGKDQLEVLFVLVKSVTIPERSFLRAGFDQNIEKIVEKIEDNMQKVIELKINPDVFADMIGLEFAGLIQKHMRDLKTPPKAPVTLAANPRKTNPLMDSGRLVGAIRHEVE